MAGVVVSRRIVDVQAITADSGRNVDVRWRREMTDRWGMVRGSGIGGGWWRSGGRSEQLRESLDGDSTAEYREPEESAGGEVADAGTYMGSE